MLKVLYSSIVYAIHDLRNEETKPIKLTKYIKLTSKNKKIQILMHYV